MVSYYYIRRFLGGRHPLCGTGVRSSSLEIFSPPMTRPRTAISRPLPRPFRITLTVETPSLCAFLAKILPWPIYFQILGALF